MIKCLDIYRVADANLFLKSMVQITLLMILSFFSKWVLGAPPHARVAYSVYGFINAIAANKGF